VARPNSGALEDLFSDNAYNGGALVLYALRQKVGGLVFHRIERAWVRDNAGRSAGTGDFIALASRVSNRKLGPFLHAWLYEKVTPAMPGHPEWSR
jgi:aminopeptidase N